MNVNQDFQYKIIYTNVLKVKSGEEVPLVYNVSSGINEDSDVFSILSLMGAELLEYLNTWNSY